MVFHVQHDCSCFVRQAPATRQGEGRFARARLCLLKGCQRWFSPGHPLARYCSEACREAARRWSRWQAARRYRASPHGQERRRQQASRYRERVRQRREASGKPPTLCEGHQEAADSEKIPCSRPGCYELFASEPRSPLKRFCSSPCCEAFRRVRRREARWERPHDSYHRHDHFKRTSGPPGASR